MDLLDEAAVTDRERAAWNGPGAIRRQAGAGPGRLGLEGERDAGDRWRDRETRNPGIHLRVVRERAATRFGVRVTAPGMLRRTVRAGPVARGSGRLVGDLVSAVIFGGEFVSDPGIRRLLHGGCDEPRRLVGGDAGNGSDLHPRQRDERKHRPGQRLLSSPDPLQAGHVASHLTATARKLARLPCTCNFPIAA